MKIDSLFENVTPSSTPVGNQSQQAPKFGRDPKVLEDDKIEETTAGATGSGAVASVSQPMGTIQKRKGTGALLRGISTSEKYPNSKAVKEDEIVEQDIIINPSLLTGPKPGFHNRMDMEGDTVKNSLHTIIRVADDLNDRIENHTQFPEWVSEKIGAIKSMMVNVMDYVISQQERGDDHVIDEFAVGEEIYENAQVLKLNDYDQWLDKVDALGAEKHMQKNRTLIVAQSWDGNKVGEFDLKSNQGWVMSQGVAEGSLNEGVMDQLKSIYMMLVSDLPMGTPESEFLGHWQRIIKNELGKNIKIDTLAKLRNNFINRYKSMGRRGDAVDWHREMGQELSEVVVIPPNMAASNYVVNIEPKQKQEREAAAKEKAASSQQFPISVKEGSLNEFVQGDGGENGDGKIYYAVQDHDKHYSTYALNRGTIDTDEFKARFGKKLWVKGPFMDLSDAQEAIWAHIEKNKGVAEGIYVPEIPRAPQPKPDPKNKTVDEDWQKVNRKDKTSGMSKKAVKAYRRENPGSKLQTAVTTKPSKLKKGSKSAKRRKSFCARMKGMKKAHAGAKTKRNPDSPINKALRRWNCESIEEMQHLIMVAEQQINELKDTKQIEENLHKWFKEKWVRFGPDGKIRGDCARGDDSEGKPKCLPQSKAHSLGKKGRASAAARKRREDPNPERSGKAINVATKKKTNETNLDEKWSEKYKKSIDCSNPKGFSQRAHCQGRKKNEDQQLDEKCWDTHKQVGMKKKGGRMVPNCVPKESVNEEQNLCPHCGGLMYEMSMMNEKKDACYYKVKSRYKVWPSAYASGALVKCRKKGAKNWGTKSEGVETDQQPQQDSQPQKQTTPDYLNTIKNVGTAALALKDKNLADLLKQELYQMLYNKTSGEPNR